MRPKWVPPSTPLRVAAAGPEVPFPACLLWARPMQISCPTLSLSNPPLKVEGLAAMAPCHSLWASENPFRFLPKVLQEPAVETSGCACVFAPGSFLCTSMCVLGAGPWFSPATPFTVPQNRVAEGVASLALARPVCVVCRGSHRPLQSQVVGGTWSPQALLGIVILSQTFTADMARGGLWERKSPAAASCCRCLWRKEEAQRPPRGLPFPSLLWFAFPC